MLDQVMALLHMRGDARTGLAPLSSGDLVPARITPASVTGGVSERVVEREDRKTILIHPVMGPNFTAAFAAAMSGGILPAALVSTDRGAARR